MGFNLISKTGVSSLVANIISAAFQSKSPGELNVSEMTERTMFLRTDRHLPQAVLEENLSSLTKRTRTERI